MSRHTTRSARTRIEERIRALAAIGATASGGITRLAYTQCERDAHALLARWGDDAAKEVATDAAGNTIVTFVPGRPYFLLGSHLDTVVDGGAYDGSVGVVAAFEAATRLADRTSHGLRVVAFAGEEGARFGRPNLGSAAAAGLLDGAAVRRLRDSDGVTLEEAAASVALAPAAAPRWLGDDVACFFEVHIEQGRQLELASARIGLVDVIAGSIRLRIDVGGRADHSGATPMEIRADALAAASEVVLATEEVAGRYRSTVATVGRIEIMPNSVTTVPGRATLWVDVRDVDPEQQRVAAAAIVEAAGAIAERRAVRLTVELLSSQPPVVLDAWPRALALGEAEQARLAFRVMPSGAGHDAAVVARRAPSALLFIPCEGGISHSPAEHASAADIDVAAGLVAAVVERADALVAAVGNSQSSAIEPRNADSAAAIVPSA